MVDRWDEYLSTLKSFLMGKTWKTENEYHSSLRRKHLALQLHKLVLQAWKNEAMTTD